EKFNKLLLDIKNNGQKNPFEIVERFDGKKLVFHGNHRYACSLFLGREPLVNKISIEDFLIFNTRLSDLRFSSDKNGLPYQTIFYKREPLIIGRRKDQIERHNMIDQSDIVGKRIFDFGCNIGTSCILAHESGAIVEGYDLPKILNSAVR